MTGREPLNNQPYFHVQVATLDELLPLVRGHAEAPVRLLVKCLEELQKVTKTQQARDALRAFIRVRRGYQLAYPMAPKVPPKVTPVSFVSLAERVVGADAEGGKRAQAVASGVLDAVAGEDFVLVGRINDPDRHFPGDVGVLEEAGGNHLAYAIEVRNKRVSAEDITMFGRKLAEKGVSRGGVLAVAGDQPRVTTQAAEVWASKQGVHLVSFFGWKSFLEQAFFWSEDDAAKVCEEAYRRARVRLEELEADPVAIVMWDKG